MTTDSAPTTASASGSALAVELNGLNVIPESERKGNPRDLFWPWCASNISVFGISYGSYVLGFGISRNQALVAAVLGVIASFLLVGLVSLAGKRGSAPTLVLSRAPFGVHGNAFPAAVSYLLLVGWETVLVSLATFATATVFGRLGWGDGDATMVSAFIVVAAIIVAAGVLGFDAIMRLQKYLTILTLIVTVGYIALTLDEIDGSAVADLPSGGGKALIGALVLVVTGFGISWVNSAADYSRYLPRNASSRGIIGWVTFGGSLPVVILVIFGVFLAGSDPELSENIAADPIGALTPTLPEWFLVPFIVVAVAGLVSGAVLDIYSSGLSLLALGLPAPRWAASALDGAIMVVGTIYIVWIADDFLTPFLAFLITLGVPIAAWCGVFLADLLLRKRDYDEAGLYDAGGVYGSVNAAGLGSMVVGTVIGWGLVVNANEGFRWQGYLMDALGLGPKNDGPWTYANLGVLVALVLPFLLYVAFGRAAVRRQESAPAASQRGIGAHAGGE
jgi:NCS1 family nucleobase:cation symporter-1